MQCSGTENDPLHFTGKERDSETGNDYFGARYYASNTGRMMTTDPHSGTALHKLNPQRWNMYAYALNNPLSFTDPTGKDAVTVNFSQMVAGAGHEGIISIHSDGSATYARFGPAEQTIGGGWGVSEPGEVRSYSMPRVEFGSDGLPTPASYALLVQAAAAAEGVGDLSTVRMNYFKTSDLDASHLDAWMQQRKGAPGRYRLFSRNCATFTVEGLRVGGAIPSSLTRGFSIDPNALFLQLIPYANDSRGKPQNEPEGTVTTTEDYYKPSVDPCVDHACYSD
jgi:RHS repeat-associated protein